MNLAGNITNYYASGNTARGFYSVYESILQQLERVFILTGGPGTGKSSLMRDIGVEWVKKGYDVEFLHCPSDNESIDGMIIPALKVSIIDGTVPWGIELRAPGIIEKYVHMNTAWDEAQLTTQKDEILHYTMRMKESLQKAYATFAEALAIHDEWEKIYILNMDFDKANELTQSTIQMLFGDQSTHKKPITQHRFLGAATPNGPVDFIQNLTADIPKRYFIKGRPGSGKSTMLKKIARHAEGKGFDVEVYHCGFDPKSLDMVVVRELGFAIFDSTAPHEYFPNRDGDETIDMYGTVIAPETDEKYNCEIASVSQRYKAKMKEGTAFLLEAKSWRDKRKQLYTKAMDFAKVNEIKEMIQSEINTIVE